MKKIYSILFFTIVVSYSATSQIDSIIYGISSLSPNNGIFLAKINPLTGLVSNISSAATNIMGQSTQTVLDPVNNIFYYPLDSAILSFNLVTGELLGTTPIILLPNTSFRGANFNTVDNKIYALSWNSPLHEVYLSWLNPSTGIVTRISNNSIARGFNMLESSTLDPVHHVFYFETTDTLLVGADLYTGEVVTSVKMKINQGIIFGPIVYSCTDSTLYGLIGNMSVGRKLGKIDVFSGDVTEISSDTIAHAIISNQSTIDPFHGIYYFQNINHRFVGVNINTGNIVTNPVVIPSSGAHFTNPYFNYSCFYTYALDINGHSNDLLKIFPNPANQTLNINLPSFENCDVEIFNLIGSAVYKHSFRNKKEISIDISGFAENVYSIRVLRKDNVFTSKFAVKR